MVRGRSLQPPPAQLQFRRLRIDEVTRADGSSAPVKSAASDASANTSGMSPKSGTDPIHSRAGLTLLILGMVALHDPFSL
jgi:hypothetical protein